MSCKCYARISGWLLVGIYYLYVGEREKSSHLMCDYPLPFFVVLWDNNQLHIHLVYATASSYRFWVDLVSKMTTNRSPSIAPAADSYSLSKDSSNIHDIEGDEIARLPFVEAQRTITVLSEASKKAVIIHFLSRISSLPNSLAGNATLREAFTVRIQVQISDGWLDSDRNLATRYSNRRNYEPKNCLPSPVTR